MEEWSMIIIFIFFSLTVAFFAISCILAIEYRKHMNIIERQKNEIKELQKMSEETSLDGQSNRLQYTLQLFSFIDNLVSQEVTNTIKFGVILGEKYDISKLDKDIKQVSEHVYKKILPLVFSNNVTIVTPEAIFTHITSSVSTELFSFIYRNRSDD